MAIIGRARCPLAGAIGMNCTMARVPAGTPVAEGDEAVVLGNAEGVRLDEVAAAANTIPHALLTSLARGIGVRAARATA